MQCSNCNLEMAVSYGYNMVTGDASDKEETKLFRVIVYQCMNEGCGNFLRTYEERLREEVGLPMSVPKLIPKG